MLVCYQNELLWGQLLVSCQQKKISMSISHLILKLFRGQICMKVRYSPLNDVKKIQINKISIKQLVRI